MKFKWKPGGKTRRHHNNTGRRQIKNGKSRAWAEAQIKKLFDLKRG